MSLCVLVLAAVTKYHWLPSLNSNLFLIVLEAGTSKLIWDVVRALFLVCRGTPCCVFHGRECKLTLVDSYEGTNPTIRTPPSFPHLNLISSQRPPPSNTITFGAQASAQECGDRTHEHLIHSIVTNNKSMDFAVRSPGFESSHCYLVAVWLWAHYTLFLSVRFPIWKLDVAVYLTGLWNLLMKQHVQGPGGCSGHISPFLLVLYHRSVSDGQCWVSE